MVVPMTRVASACPLGPKFDPFLLAQIGADRNGTPLSVLSALARMGVDPWQEAARLTELPEASATQAMVALLAKQPDGLSVGTSNGIAAARLIALLPRRGGPSKPPWRAMTRGTAATGSSTTVPAILFFVLLALVLSMEALTANQRPPPPMAPVQTRASTTALPGPQPRSAKP